MYRMVGVTINTFKTWIWNAFEYFPLCQNRINLNVYAAIRNSTWYVNEYYSVGTLLLLTLFSSIYFIQIVTFKITFILTWISHIHITSNTAMTSHHCVRCAISNCCHYTQYHCSYRTLVSYRIFLPLKLTFTVQLFENYPKHVQPLRPERKKLLLLSGATHWTAAPTNRQFLLLTTTDSSWKSVWNINRVPINLGRCNKHSKDADMHVI
jgi:hypothetical protein